MGVGVRLADLREQQRRHSQQGGVRAEASRGRGEAEFGEGKTEAGSAEPSSGGVRTPYSAVGNELVQMMLGSRKHAAMNDYLPAIVSEEEGRRMLIAAKIATAVWDALGQGMTGRNREGLISSAWLYLESPAFRHDLDLVGFFVDVDAFLRDLRKLADG